ncbi:acyl-CoA carboxylase epsilon subunit [Streptomyces sp. enrichment culture]|uniref:acyl-CoA carboxylase epsilon subunit n=1 Tax=Streptomyces sp. enrichment culture TaxID=1795815 RepID=UPI003F551BB4
MPLRGREAERPPPCGGGVCQERANFPLFGALWSKVRERRADGGGTSEVGVRRVAGLSSGSLAALDRPGRPFPQDLPGEGSSGVEGGESLFRVERGEVREDELAALAAVLLALCRSGGPVGVSSAETPLWWRPTGGYVAPGGWR